MNRKYLEISTRENGAVTMYHYRGTALGDVAREHIPSLGWRYVAKSPWYTEHNLWHGGCAQFTQRAAAVKWLYKIGIRSRWVHA